MLTDSDDTLAQTYSNSKCLSLRTKDTKLTTKARNQPW